RQRLEGADLEGLGLAERGPPRRRDQHGRPESARGTGGQAEEAPAGRLATPPRVPGPELIPPAFRHPQSPLSGVARSAVKHLGPGVPLYSSTAGSRGKPRPRAAPGWPHHAAISSTTTLAGSTRP